MMNHYPVHVSGVSHPFHMKLAFSPKPISNDRAGQSLIQYPAPPLAAVNRSRPHAPPVLGVESVPILEEETGNVDSGKLKGTGDTNTSDTNGTHGLSPALGLDSQQKQEPEKQISELSDSLEQDVSHPNKNHNLEDNRFGGTAFGSESPAASRRKSLVGCNVNSADHGNLKPNHSVIVGCHVPPASPDGSESSESGNS